MEAGRNFGIVSSEQLETFENLGDREKNAVAIALEGIHRWQTEGKKPHAIRVEITEEKPFDLRSFTSFMHEMGIDIVGTLEEVGANAVIFQPKPYDDRERSILGGAIVIPDGLQKYFK
ncbi:MAG: hypothetical protein HYT08_04630 [Candidatus Levybacteria bacterium]|nr:hypothetical protein [Candidatus Levybacteria bacterium]